MSWAASRLKTVPNLKGISGTPVKPSVGRSLDVERLSFFATVVLAGATIWIVPHPPISDLAQHAGQVAVWHDLLFGISKWQPLLYVNYFTPYLLGYCLALGLSFFMPVAAALKLTLTLAYYGFVIACVLLRRRLGGDRRLDWLFIPGFFGYAFVWGFYPFLIAAPIGVLFILVAHHYADQPAVTSGAILFLAGLALFYSHGMTFMFGNAVGVVFVVLRHHTLVRTAVLLLPYVGLGLWLVLYALLRIGAQDASISGLLGVDWAWDATRLNFLVFSMGAFEADWIFGVLCLLMFAAPLAIGARLNGRNVAVFVPLGCTLIVWLTVPHMVLHTAHIFQRFALFLLPFYALLFAAPRDLDNGGPQATPRRIAAALWLPVLCWLFLALKVERLLAFAGESAAFDVVAAAAQPGHRALGLILDPASAATGNGVAYAHFPLWYQAKQGGFVDYNFADTLAMVVRFRPERAPAVSYAGWAAAKFDWTRDLAEIYRYFFVRHVAPLPAAYFPEGQCKPVLLKSAGDWSLFENVNCYRAPT